MIQKEINNIEKSDLENLIENSVKESKTIEYKESLCISSEREKKEFLSDVSSFANASGGDLIFGIRENRETGFPEELVGIEINNIDSLQLKIDTLLRDTISPRLNGIQSKVIELEKNRSVLILRITKSWNAPHQVTYKGTDKFYTRSNNGKYKLDVIELRNAFLASETLGQNIKNFRTERIANIVSNEGFAPLMENGKIILHIIPFQSFETGKIFQISDIVERHELMKPLGNVNHYDIKYNFDGLLSYDNYNLTDPSHSYLQLFKKGIIETVDSWFIQEFNGERKLYLNQIEEMIWGFMHKIPKFYNHLKITPPFVALLTMTGVKGYQLGLPTFYPFGEPIKVEKETLVFPEIVFEDWNTKIDKLIKPWFDSMWNSVGKKESPNYVDDHWQIIKK